MRALRDVFFLTSGQFRAPSFLIDPPSAARPPVLDGAGLGAEGSGGLRARLKAQVAPVLLSNTVAVAIRHDDSVVLVDCGWSELVCADPIRALGRSRAALLGLDVRAHESVAVQLQGLGFDLRRVETIVSTHLHLDHVGGVCDFPDAVVVTTERELAAYRTFGARAGYRAEDLAAAGRVRVVPLESSPTWGFPASSDLFGDGSVVLLDARGHSRGSIAVALRTHEQNYVHVGDAVYRLWEYGLSPAGPSRVARTTMWNRARLEETYAALRACEADKRRPVIVPSHDIDVFEQLPHRPAALSGGVARRTDPS